MRRIDYFACPSVALIFLLLGSACKPGGSWKQVKLDDERVVRWTGDELRVYRRDNLIAVVGSVANLDNVSIYASDRLLFTVPVEMGAAEPGESLRYIYNPDGSLTVEVFRGGVIGSVAVRELKGAAFPGPTPATPATPGAH
jgi:hypothetical protein